MRTPEEVARLGNEKAMELCRAFADELGSGVNYKLAVGAAATAFLFHMCRLAAHNSNKAVIEIMDVILEDVSHNIVKHNNFKLKFKVEIEP
jgi:hypothetical protein